VNYWKQGEQTFYGVWCSFIRALASWPVKQCRITCQNQVIWYLIRQAVIDWKAWAGILHLLVICIVRTYKIPLKEWAANVESVNLASELTVALYFKHSKNAFWSFKKLWEKYLHIGNNVYFTSEIRCILCYTKRQNYRSRYVNSAPSNLVRIILFV
jgi:hypothetical protein